MSTLATLDPAIGPAVVPQPLPQLPEPLAPPATGWEPGEFARDQIQRMVRQLFLAPRAKPARYVTFMAVDRETEIGTICLQAGRALAEQLPGTVCIAAGDPRSADLSGLAGLRLVHPPQHRNGDWKNGERLLRSASSQLAGNLWLAPARLFRGENGNASSLWMEGKMADLRLEFDYAVIQSPAADSSDAGLLSTLSDGAVLVIAAGRTRRVAAQMAKVSLVAAGVRVLGTVLCEREFPVPEKIYRWL